MQIPTITTPQMIEVDRLMIEEYKIQLIQMMENAGRNLAELNRRILGGELHSKRISILCGGGNNGGGGMVAARHLHNWGAQVSLKIITDSVNIKEIPAHQLHILEMMGVTSGDSIDLDESELILDAMIGYGMIGNPRAIAADWIQRVNQSARPVLALDTPSGLDTTTGEPADPCIRAAATMTLALPKAGLVASAALPFVGDLYLADISVPPQLYARLGIDLPPIFIHDSVIKISGSERL